MIKRITKKLRKTGDIWLFHNSKDDVVELAKMINIIVDKLNEIIDEVNQEQVANK
jgi:ligand-binding SRPBCC domain-containing protein